MKRSYLMIWSWGLIPVDHSACRRLISTAFAAWVCCAGPASLDIADVPSKDPRITVDVRFHLLNDLSARRVLYPFPDPVRMGFGKQGLKTIKMASLYKSREGNDREACFESTGW